MTATFSECSVSANFRHQRALRQHNGLARGQSNKKKTGAMEIHVTRVFVDDQTKAERFRCDLPGLRVRDDGPLGEFRWLTVTETGTDGKVQLLQ